MYVNTETFDGNDQNAVLDISAVCLISGAI